MSGKLIFVVGMLGIAGYVGKNMGSYDPSIVAQSREQVQALLADATTTLPRRDGPGEIKIWGTGKTDKGVSLKMQYASWAPVLDCDAVITAVAPDKSKVVADCGGASGKSAIGNTEVQLRAPMFDEFIQSKLEARDFDRKLVDQKEAAVVFKNLDGMQREALRESDKMNRMIAEGRN